MTSTFVYTQGPWKATLNRKFGRYSIHHNNWCSPGETSIMAIYPLDLLNPSLEDDNNAKLMAAAPEMYSAIRDLLDSTGALCGNAGTEEEEYAKKLLERIEQ